MRVCSLINHFISTEFGGTNTTCKNFLFFINLFSLSKRLRTLLQWNFLKDSDVDDDDNEEDVVRDDGVEDGDVEDDVVRDDRVEDGDVEANDDDDDAPFIW